MSIQPSIDSFFGKRKRLVNDEIYKSKHLKRDDKCNIHINAASRIINLEETKNFNGSLENFMNEKTKIESLKSGDIPSKIDQIAENHKNQVTAQELKSKSLDKQLSAAYVSPVKFHLMGNLSPAKKSSIKIQLNDQEPKAKQEQIEERQIREKSKSIDAKNPLIRNLNFSAKKNMCPTEDIINSAKQLVTKIKETQKKLATDCTKKKELSLKEIKDKINKSSKLNELKKSINKINQHAEELIQFEKKKLTMSQPKLPKFTAFDITVPISPSKNSLHVSTDLKSSPSKPAFERFSSLADSSTLLPLPFGYQKIYELFCAADTISSMIINRKEILTFNKLRPAVEEMTRKSFTTRHLGQIATIYPEAFTFHYEKKKNYGSTSKVDKYELVITPLLASGSESMTTRTDNRGMDSRIISQKDLKFRKETFYKNLLERTKNYHEEFLKSLEPPIKIDGNQLKRWHPNFMVDQVPDINPQELPEPPNSEKTLTAKEILSRAREFLKSNERLHKALEEVAEKTKNKEVCSTIDLDIKQKVDSRLKDPLKGISKSLLEKVRAKQAAKALDAMLMTPEQEKEILVYTRLPEFARIIRTTFINEQKAVLLLEILLEKVQFSYNRALGLSEVETHIRLLSRILPEWLSIINIRNVHYAKINRNADPANVLTKLKKIVEEKKAGKHVSISSI